MRTVERTAMRIPFIPLAALALAAHTTLSPAAVLYVNGNSSTPAPPYSTWGTAARTIQDAVDATSPGDTVLVTNGIYQTGGRIGLGSLSNRVAITKAVTVLSVNGPASTVIQGSRVPGAANDITAVRCVYVTNGAMLSGFTLTNGVAFMTHGSGPDRLGGGAYCQSLTAVLSNCVLSGSLAMIGGGAAGGTLIRCVVSNNSAQSSGGGAYTNTLLDCLLTGNSAASGGAVAVIEGVTARLNNCTVYGNQASVQGGGLAALGAGAPAYLWASNCIVLGNTAPSGSNYTFGVSQTKMNYCCTAPVPSGSVGSFLSDPIFVNPAAGDFHLGPGSLCINAGDNLFATGTTDLDGNARVAGAYADIGAYEFQGSAPVPIIPSIQVTYTGVATGTVVSFTGQIVGHPTASKWDFGDGVVVSNLLPTVTHSWTAAGDYVAGLWAYNASYPAGQSATVIIHVLDQPVHYVSQTSSTPTAPYLSWDTAATTIQDAIDAAYVNGTVLVTNGIYSSGGMAVGGGTTNRAALTKQITVRSVNGPAVTTIEGYQVPGTTNGNSAVRCAYLTNNALLAGFTLRNGATKISNSANAVGVQSGGGVFSESISAVISNCILTGNRSYYAGGGAYSGTLKNCSFIGNSSDFGGGSHSGALETCVLIGNSADDGGGVMSWLLTVNNCTLTGNTANYKGGGAAYTLLNNCILENNFAPSGPNYDDGTLPCTLNFCCATPLPSNGTGNFTNTALLVDAPGGDVHLSASSPCINAGNNLYVTTSSDLDGAPRIVGGTVDVGAYEFQTPASILSYAWAQQYGLATDGSADYADTDGDGMNNWQEWIAGTVPTNAASVLSFLPPSKSGAGFNVTWRSVSGRTYYLQRAGKLSPPPAFTVIQSNITGQAGSTSYLDSTATNGGPYFYRVGVQ